jgi:hypothetical protein
MITSFMGNSIKIMISRKFLLVGELKTRGFLKNIMTFIL